MNERGNAFDVAGSPVTDGSARAARVEPISRTKRALLKAGWVAPVIAVISLPASGTVGNLSCNPYDPDC